MLGIMAMPIQSTFLARSLLKVHLTLEQKLDVRKKDQLFITVFRVSANAKPAEHISLILTSLTVPFGRGRRVFNN